jgi:hypothetical protein
MRSKSDFVKDTKAIQDIVLPYHRNDSCFVMILAQEGGKVSTSFGGRVDIAGTCIAEVLARIVERTPEINEDFIDVVATIAHDFVKEGKKIVPLKPQ